jgi:hypothetical protein
VNLGHNYKFIRAQNVSNKNCIVKLKKIYIYTKFSLYFSLSGNPLLQTVPASYDKVVGIDIMKIQEEIEDRFPLKRDILSHII